MYIRLRLKNWRSIDDATVVIAPFTVIVGRNSSGKSNVIDALRFASEVVRDAETAVQRRGGITSLRRWGAGKPHDITVGVRVATERDRLDDSFSGHEFVIRSGKDGDWHFVREVIEATERGEDPYSLTRVGNAMELEPPPTNGVLQAMKLGGTRSAMVVAETLLPEAGSYKPLEAVRAIHPVPESMRKPQPPTETARLVESAENITSALRRLSAAARQEVVAAMQRIVPGLLEIQVVPAGRYLTLSFTQAHGRGRHPEFAATEMSDGALRALAVIVAAQQMKRNELLIIEEPEVNLHPGAADVVYDVLHRASKRGAVLVTTHSPEILDRAKDDEILVCEYVDGVTKIGPLSSAQRDLVREGLFSAAELMRSEELRREGAAPRVVAD